MQEKEGLKPSCCYMDTYGIHFADKNIELILQVCQEVPKKCLRFLEVKIKGQGKVVKQAIVSWLFTLSQAEIGRKLIVSSYDIPK